MQLGLRVGRYGGWCTLDVSGDLDITSSPALRQKVVQLVAAGERQIVLDLSEVDFIDSTGLGTIIGALKRVRTHDGELEVVCPSARLRRVFAIVGFDRVLTLHDDLGSLAVSDPR